jgi:hypothetical protein
MMSVIPARIVGLSATTALKVRAVDHPSHKCESQRRLGIVMGEEISLLYRSDRVFWASTRVAASTENPSGKCRIRHFNGIDRMA